MMGEALMDSGVIRSRPLDRQSPSQTSRLFLAAVTSPVTGAVMFVTAGVALLQRPIRSCA